VPHGASFDRSSGRGQLDSEALSVREQAAAAARLAEAEDVGAPVPRHMVADASGRMGGGGSGGQAPAWL